MAKEVFQGDYLGFSFNGIHSSELGLVRVNGSNISDQLLPQITDITTVPAKKSHTLYYGTTYQQRTFSINFAFEKLTEEEIIKIKQTFNDNGIHKLIYDETPYKSYRAKARGASVIKHLAFVDGQQNRYYNGEGSISFISYFPFAISEFSSLNSERYNQDWRMASDIPAEGLYGTVEDNQAWIYNAGDDDMIIKVTLNVESLMAEKIDFEIRCQTESGDEKILYFNNMPLQNKYIDIDFFRGTVYGYNSNDGTEFNKISYLAYQRGETLSPSPKETMRLVFYGQSKTGTTVNEINFDSITTLNLEYLYI